ncbi:KWG Leptospira [compost metagenome]
MIHRRLLIASAVLFSTFSIHAQTLVFQAKPAGGKTWGYVGVNGEFLIPAEYEKCYEFSSNGLAIIYDAKIRQHYLINLKNEKQQTEQPDFKIKDGFGFSASTFHNELLLVKIGAKWGYMNTSGKMAIPANYDDGNDFNGGFAAVKKGSQFVILDTKGKETEIKTPALDVRDFSEGLAPIRTVDKKFGFINTKGELVVPSQFESVGYFSNGLAWAKTADKKLGYIDQTGKWIIEPQFEAGKEFDSKSGLARVKQGENWTYINKKGEIVNISDSESLGDFSEGLAEGKKGALKGFYDNKGQWVIKPQFDDVRSFQNGYAAAKMNGKWGLIDKTGKWIVEAKFDAIKDVTLVK